MGNASGRDAEENEADDSSMRSAEEAGLHREAAIVQRRHPVEMQNSPPMSPERLQSPLMFAPQVPIAPLQTVSDVHPVFNQSQMSETDMPMSASFEKGIPALITWCYDGDDVSVEGSWDNWTTRKALQRSGKDHAILLVLPSGVFHYKFLVDGKWRYIPDLPCIADAMGNFTNILDVHEYIPESLESVSEFEPPLSPSSSYSKELPVEEDFAKEPSNVPPQLHLSVHQSSGEVTKRPNHVVLDHLFIERGWGSHSVIALGFTHRFRSKYVTVVLYKPMRR